MGINTYTDWENLMKIKEIKKKHKWDREDKEHINQIATDLKKLGAKVVYKQDGTIVLRTTVKDKKVINVRMQADDKDKAKSNIDKWAKPILAVIKKHLPNYKLLKRSYTPSTYTDVIYTVSFRIDPNI